MTNNKDTGTTRAVIHVTLKPGVLDPQGQAVCNALRNLGYNEVEEVRVGKRLEVRLAPGNGGGPRERLQGMCRDLLSNPVIEDFRVELIED
jgi:phosphoribosylformylglycinamidine synthase